MKAFVRIFVNQKLGQKLGKSLSGLGLAPVKELRDHCYMRIFAFIVLLCGATRVQAHASDQVFVSQLPTGIYTVAGITSVGLTMILLALLPAKQGQGRRRILRLDLPDTASLRRASSLLSTLVLLWLFHTGFTGSHDPLANLLPLVFWVVFWIVFVIAQGIFGNLWPWIEPWGGLYARIPLRPFLRLPARLGYWPAVILQLGFAGFLLIDPAPADPERLARLGLAYWGLTLLGAVIFGPVWLRRGEFLGVFLGQIARVSALKWTGSGLRISWPGWQLLTRCAVPLSLAMVPLVTLASGSFDGVNETFWWLALNGINPLMPPGRSAVMLPNALGLLMALCLVTLLLLLALWLGQRLAGQKEHLADMFAHFTPGLLPIALGYHMAHYGPGALMETQYVALAVAQLFGGEGFYVTGSFYYDPGLVHLIWVLQAASVVGGHILSVILTHRIALAWFENPRAAVLGQIPLGLFMLAYTFFGLWLLATLKG